MVELDYSNIHLVHSHHRTQAAEQLDIPVARVMDTLNTIFAGQLHLMHRYHYIEEANGAVVIEHPHRGIDYMDDCPGCIDDRGHWGELNNRYVQMRLKDLLMRVVVEIGEAAEELKNKPWRQTETPTDVKAFHKEVSDILHFFVEFCITAGITADKLFELYFEKHAENIARQDGGY